MEPKMKKIKSMTYIAIFCFFCIVDQRRGSAAGRVQFIFINLAMAAVCLLPILQRPFKSYLKWSYYLYTGACMVITIFFGTLRQGDLIAGKYFVGEWYAGCLMVWLLGVLLQKTWEERKKVIRNINPLWILFVGMLAFAGASVDESTWPLWYLGSFGLLYLTSWSKEEKELLLDSLSSGLILSFFILQGLAFLFRPFDSLRYNGMYANPNMNALYYMCVYCGFLSKYCVYYVSSKTDEKAKKKDFFIRIFFLVFGTSLLALVLFTQCRSAILGMAVSTGGAGIYCMKTVGGKWFRRGLGMFAGFLLCIVVTLPVTYLAVRYLPSVFHHPIWFGGEYSEEKVNSLDPYDSPKYTDWRQIFGSFIERLKGASENSVVETEETEAEGNAEDMESIIIVEKTFFAQKAALNNEQLKSAVYDYEEENSLKIRKAIYGYYLSKLNLVGHMQAENGLQVTPGYFAPHAHNLFLQMAFSFGLPVGILFLIWIAWVVCILFRNSFLYKKRVDPFLYEIAILIFGLTEIMWRTGQLSFFLFFFLALYAMEREREENRRNGRIG